MSLSIAALATLAAAASGVAVASYLRARSMRLDHDRFLHQTLDLNAQLAAADKELRSDKEALQKLQLQYASRCILAQIPEISADGCCICNTAGEIEWVNKSWELVTGYTLSEVRGRRPGHFLHGPDTAQETIQRFRSGMATRQTCTEELANYTKAGNRLWVRVGIRPALDESGRHIGWIGTLVDLTLKKLTQKRLERLNERAEMALAAGDYGIWEWWIQPNRCEWDERCCRLHGVAQGASNYEEWMQCVHREDLAPLENHLRSVLLGREPLHTNFRLSTQPRHIEIRGSLQSDEQGAPQRLTGLVRDITSEITLRENLALALERLRLSLHGSNDGVWEWSPLPDTLTIDERWQGLTGSLSSQAPASRAALISRVHPEDVSRLSAAMDAHLNARTSSLDCEVRVGRENGDWVWVHWRGKAVPSGSDPSQKRLCGTYTDVTDRHRTDNALRRSALLLRQMCQQLGIAAWQVEAETFALHWTEELDLLHSAPPDFDPTLEHFFGLYPPESRRELSRALEKAIEKQEPFDIEVRWRPQASGPNGWFRWTGRAVLSEGRVQAVCGLIQDVSETHEAAAQRRELDSRLAELHQYEALSAITEDLAYDLNSMLGTMIGYQEIAAEELPEQSKAGQYLRESMRTSSRTHDIIRQVLLLNRVKPSVRILLRLPLLVDELFERQRAILPTGIAITRNIDRQCPTILGDAAQLQQAFNHLATHAAGALLGRPGRLEITLRQADVGLAEAAALGLGLSGACACLEIKVTRSHLADKEWSQLFEHPSNDPGLALTAARKVLSEHQGVLWVEFHPVHGGLCQAWLPLSQTLREHPPSAQPVPHGSGEHIWIVDTERFIAHLCRLTLERNGYAVDVFRSEEACLEALRERGPECALVLLGGSLTHEAAGAALSRLHELKPGLPALALSSAQDIARLKGFTVLQEPFTAADLLRSLHNALNPSHGHPKA